MKNRRVLDWYFLAACERKIGKEKWEQFRLEDYWEKKSFTQLDECLNKYEKYADKRPIWLKKTWAEPLFLLFLFGENRLLPPTEQNNFSTTTTKGLNKLIAPNCTISLKTCFRGFYYCTMKPSCTKNRQAPALHPQLNADVNILALNILIDL